MKIAILGVGFMGKKHKIAISSFPDVEIVAEIDHFPSSSEIYYPSLEEFLDAKVECDLVVISTPNHLHTSHALVLLENGYHVLIEKPFCFNSEEALQLEEASKRTGYKAFLVVQNRFSPVTYYLKDLFEHNKLGKIYNIQFNAFWNRGKSYYTVDSWKGKKEEDGGILFTQFSHLIDLVTYLFEGESLNVLYQSFENFRNREIAEIEDTAIVILETAEKSKIVLNFTTAVFEKNQETSLNILAEKGTIKISGQYFNEITYENIDPSLERIQLKEASNEDHLKLMYTELFKNLRGDPANKAVLLKDGFPLVQLLENLYSLPIENNY